LSRPSTNFLWGQQVCVGGDARWATQDGGKRLPT